MEQSARAKKNPFKIIFSVILIIAILICGVIIFFNVTHSYYVVYGPSMAPTLNEGIVDVDKSKDGVFVSKIKSYNRGDIIVLDRNYGEEGVSQKYVIKRLIAISGDKITIGFYNNDYRIFLIRAGESEVEILEENYLFSYSVNEVLYNNFNAMVENLNIERDESGYITIPDEQIFVIGDNRPQSIDSSTYGPKPKEAVVGKVDYIAYGNTDIYLQVIKQFFGW